MASPPKKSTGTHGLTARASSDADVTASLNAIRRIFRVLRLSSSAIEKAHGVSPARLFVLHELASGGPYSIAELAGQTRKKQKID